MFNYDQNAQLTQIHQRERLDEGARSRLADDGKPRTHIFSAVVAYTLRKLGALAQALKSQTQPQAEVTATSTQEMAAVR